MAGGRTGLVFLEDYDIGLVRTIGGQLIDMMFDGEQAKQYALQVEGVTGPPETQDMVPIVMSDSDMAYVDEYLPQIVIARGSIPKAPERWHPGGREYFVPAYGSKQLPSSTPGKTMADMVEIKWYAYPHDINYDVHIRARRRRDADKMLRIIGEQLWTYGQIFLVDSEGEERGYYAFQESLDPLTEIQDVTQRMQGHTISLRVEGELDFRNPFVAKTQPTLVANMPKTR